MSPSPEPRLLDILRRPERALELDAAGWNDVLPRLRHARLLARLAVRLEASGVAERLPSELLAQFDSAKAAAASAARSLQWESAEVAAALGAIPFVLIKGASYAACRLPMAVGRVCADLDILVAPNALAAVERALGAAGWEATTDADEERHVRAWLHQVPALRHRRRGTALDLHHAVSPPRGTLRADARRMLEDARPSSWPGCLAPVRADMVLISAVHLARETEIADALRDVVDFDELTRDFGADPAFWPELLARADELGLNAALFFAARAARRLLLTPSPPEALGQSAGLLRRAATAALNEAAAAALMPDGVDPPGLGRQAARALLRARALRVQMPLRRLLLRSVRDKALRVQTAASALRAGLSRARAQG